MKGGVTGKDWQRNKPVLCFHEGTSGNLFVCFVLFVVRKAAFLSFCPFHEMRAMALRRVCQVLTGTLATAT